MKKTLLTLLVIMNASIIFSQNVEQDSTKKEYKNMIEIDVTELLRQHFINRDLGDYNYSFYHELYFKRFITPTNAITFGLGFGSSERNSRNNDFNKSYYRSRGYSLGVGFEHYVPLGRKWNFFFGAELWYSHGNKTYSSTSIASVTDFKQEEYTINSISLNTYAGIEYKFSGRFSVATQVNYFMSYSVKKGDILYPTQNLSNESTKTSNFNQGSSAFNLNFRYRF